MRKKQKKPVPRFETEDEEREFWSEADSTDYVDWDEGRMFRLPELRPSLKTISLRLPEWMLAELKVLANKRDIPYQSLLKQFLAERIEDAQSRVLIIPGSVFSERGTHFRLSFAAADEVLREGIEILCSLA